MSVTKSVFLHEWNCLEQVKEAFFPETGYSRYPLTNELDGVTVLLASYGVYGYEGEAFVLFERDGKLYEVNAVHCSCYGLEEQWGPEETTVEALHYRMDKGTLGKGSEYGAGSFAAELREVLAAREDRTR